MKVVPELVGRKYKTFDWFGWGMSCLGLILMARYGGVLGHEKNWWAFAACFLCFFQYMHRVAFGEIYRLVYFDTIVHSIFEVKTQSKTYHVCANDEEELRLYMKVYYPDVDFQIGDKFSAESFVRVDSYL